MHFIITLGIYNMYTVSIRIAEQLKAFFEKFKGNNRFSQCTNHKHFFVFFSRSIDLRKIRKIYAEIVNSVFPIRFKATPNYHWIRWIHSEWKCLRKQPQQTANFCRGGFVVRIGGTDATDRHTVSQWRWRRIYCMRVSSNELFLLFSGKVRWRKGVLVRATAVWCHFSL